MKKLLLLSLNLFLLLLIYLNTSPIITPVKKVLSLSFPEDSLIFDFRLESLRINRINPDVSLTDRASRLRSAILNSKEKLLIDFTVSGSANLYLTKTPDEVLSDAQVYMDSPLLNIKQNLPQGGPGGYSCSYESSFILSSATPVTEIDGNIEDWQIVPLGLRINGNLQEAFSYTDYLLDLDYQEDSQTVNREIPLDLNIVFKLLDKNGVPLANKTLSGELHYLSQDKNEKIRLVSDSQGIVKYSLSEKVKISFSQGKLKKLPRALAIPEPLYQTQIIDQSNRTHCVWAPIKDADTLPPIVMAWGWDVGRRERPPPEQRGRVSKDLSSDPRNPAGGVDPINLILGNVYTQAVDIFIPSKGMPIKFERTYNSLEDYNGVLGFGWTHSYKMNINLNESMVAILMLPDGRRLYFSYDALSDKYVAPNGEYSKLTRDADHSFIWETKYGQIYNFNSKGKLTAIRDRNHNEITLTYGPNDNLITVSASGGRKIDLSYDDKNRIASITLPNGNRVRYSYDAENNLISVRDASGSITKYRYAPHHLLEIITDPNGHNRYFSYDWHSRGISFSYDYNNHKISLTYDEANNRTVVTDSKGNKTEYYYQVINGIKLIHKIVDAKGNTEEFTWDSNLNRTQVKDKNGNITRMTYDTQGNLLTTTDPQGNVTKFSYEPRYNLVESTQDALNNLTSFSYDTKGNLIATTDALGQRTEFTYDSSGQLIQLTNARGFSTYFSYNAYGDLVLTTDALGNTTSFDYDSLGNCAKIVDARGNTKTFEYNANNQLTKIIYPDATSTTFTYDKVGNRTSVRDYLGNETRYVYDAVSRLVKVIDALSNVTTTTYDTEGNIIMVTDASDHQTRYGYDVLNRLTRTINANGIVSIYQYDNIGNRIQVKDGNGNIIKYTYDTLNRLTKITYPDASTVEFSYDWLSRRVSMKDKLGTTTYTYDALGRLTKVDGPASLDTITYAYDAVGNRSKMIDQDSGVCTYTYDELNRLKTLQDPDGKTTTYTYDDLGSLTNLTYPNSTQTSYTFDQLNRLLSLTNQKTAGIVISRYAYQYDEIGRRTRVSMADATVDFGYDKISRLTSEVRSGTHPYNISYTYDKLDNRLSLTKGIDTILYHYNSFNQLMEERRKSNQDSTLISVSGTIDDNTASVLVQDKAATVSSGQFLASGITVTRGLNLVIAMAKDPLGNQSFHQIQVNVVDPLLRKYTYDNNGNLIKKEEGTNTSTYTYDYENRLTSVTVNGATLATYTYDGEGKRIKATENGTTTVYLYDGLNVVIERDSGGSTTASYTRGLSYGGGIGGIICRKDPSGTHYFHYDGLGNVTSLTNSTGSVVKTYTYEAFGSLVSQTGTAGNPYQFQTKSFSSSTGFVHFGFRFYNPMVGRFITPDPSGMVDGPNLYAYCSNNPVNWVDPWGLRMTEQQLWDEANELENLGGLTPEQMRRLEELYDEIRKREAIEPVSIWEDPTFIILTGFRFRWKPLHIGFDIPFTKLNIIHFGKDPRFGRLGYHIAILFRGWMKALFHINF